MELSSRLPLANRLARKYSGMSFGARSVPLALLLLCLLAYGALLHRMGFYWDDWPWIWISHVEGSQGLLEIDRAYRPLAGLILWFGSLTAGKSPFAWQVLNLLFRWLSGLTLWWALGKIWPRHTEKAVWIAFIFLVYPGFNQQFVSVNSSRHILPLSAFFLSVGFMVWALREAKRYWLYTAIALIFGVVSLLATDYYYGLELVRPLILWYVAGSEPKKHLGSARRTLLYWIPYLAMFAGLALWRYTTSLGTHYPATIADRVSGNPLAALSGLLFSVVRHVYASALVAWTSLFAFPGRSEIGLLRLSLFWALVIVAFGLCIVYLGKYRQDAERSNRLQLIGLGMLSLVVGGLPFLAADIPMGLVFPADRSMLPMMFGASLLFVGVIDLLPIKRIFKVLIISLAVGLAVGAHLVTAIRYENDWQVQTSFLRQLTTRAPGLEQNSAIAYENTIALQDARFSDNSLTAALNWTYAPEFRGGRMPYFIYDLRLHAGPVRSAMRSGTPLESEYGEYTFSGSSEDVLLVQFAPPLCLHILEPELKEFYPNLPNSLSRSIRYTNTGVIQADQETAAMLPVEVFGAGESADWCTHYQQADLARQNEDWESIIGIAESASQFDDYPKHAIELVPFLQAYGYTGRWDQAVELTLDTMSADRLSKPVLCYVWSEFEDDTLDSAGKLQAIERVRTELGCQ